jgi:hypothetical protein
MPCNGYTFYLLFPSFRGLANPALAAKLFRGLANPALAANFRNHANPALAADNHINPANTASI